MTPTFQLLVPKLSRFYITVPKLSRSVPILSNSQYQNFPTHGTKTFQLFSWFLYPRLCKIVRKLVNCAKRCGKPLKVRISAENGRKCGKVRRMSKSAIPHRPHLKSVPEIFTNKFSNGSGKIFPRRSNAAAADQNMAPRRRRCLLRRRPCLGLDLSLFNLFTMRRVVLTINVPRYQLRIEPLLLLRHKVHVISWLSELSPLISVVMS